jgi:putative glycosyltransferase (TIGR04372 family)
MGIQIADRVDGQTEWRSMFGRMLDFLVVQARKTIRRPSRLLLLLMLSGRLSIALFVLRAAPKRWFDPDAWRQCYYVAAHQLLQLNRLKEASQCLERCLPDNRDPSHFLFAAVCSYHGFGRFADALTLFRRANDLREDEARKLAVAEGRWRVLDDFWSANIGHIAMLDYVIKLGILEGRSRDDTILYIPSRSRVANRFLLDQFRPHLRLVERPTDLPFCELAVKALRFDFLAPRLPDGTTVYIWELAADTYRRWHGEGRSPIMNFPADTNEQGWRALRGAGIPPDAWFVALHVRAGTWKQHHLDLHRVLDANISSYLPAITEITRRGGWVIRIGDDSMEPLQPMPNVLDYCHSDLRSDWMDGFLAARCRFMVGTSSGPAYIPSLYGVPSVLTNWWPPAQRPWHPSDLFIPKMLRRIDDGRYLTLRETLVEPFSYCHSVDYLAESEGVLVEDNDPDTIRAAVVEMLDELAGTAVVAPEVERLREAADRVYNACGAFGMSRLPRSFVRTYGSLLQ